MNKIHSTLAAPEWSIESTSGNDNTIIHRSADLSSDSSIAVTLERLDLRTDGGVQACEPSITVRIDPLNVWIDLDSETVGDPAAMARRIAAQLVTGAAELEKATAEAAGKQVFDLKRPGQRDYKSGKFSLVEQTRTSSGISEYSVCRADEFEEVGHMWDSNIVYGPRASQRRTPAEFTYRVVAKVEFDSEWFSSDGTRTARYMSV